eukprot:scaffold447443_cov32-Prasinocladus_malaysianus.AAC.1
MMVAGAAVGQRMVGFAMMTQLGTHRKSAQAFKAKKTLAFRHDQGIRMLPERKMVWNLSMRAESNKGGGFGRGTDQARQQGCVSIAEEDGRKGRIEFLSGSPQLHL